MYSTEILLNTATIRKVNLTKIDSNSVARETQNKRHYSAKLQTTKQTLTTSKHSTEFTYGDFLCYFKESRDKLTATNRRWMCKKGKRLTITANF